MLGFFATRRVFTSSSDIHALDQFVVLTLTLSSENTLRRSDVHDASTEQTDLA